MRRGAPCGQVMSVLLEEERAERRSLRTTQTQTDALSFSEGNLQLNTQLAFLHGTHTSTRSLFSGTNVLCSNDTPSLFSGVFSRPPLQPAALLGSPETDPAVGPRPPGAPRGGPPRRLDPAVRLEHVGAVPTPEGPGLRV